jgi:hypothetical protein
MSHAPAIDIDMKEDISEAALSIASSCLDDECDEGLTSIDETSRQDDERKEQEKFSAKESKEINVSRFLVFGALFVAATAVSLIVYMIASNGETQDFESQFNGFAEQISIAFHQIAKDKVGSLGPLRVAYTARARDTGAQWPFVTLTSFQQRASTAKRLSGGLQLGVFPIVEEKDRPDWESFVVTQGRSWM